MATATATPPSAVPQQQQTRSWTLPSIDKPPPSLHHPPPRSASGTAKSGKSQSGNSDSAGPGLRRSTSKSGGSRSRRQRAAERSAGTGTSDNRWTASEIAAYFGFDPNRTPSMNSASSVFPSSRFGESYASHSVGPNSAEAESRATSPTKSSFTTCTTPLLPHDRGHGAAPAVVGNHHHHGYDDDDDDDVNLLDFMRGTGTSTGERKKKTTAAGGGVSAAVGGLPRSRSAWSGGAGPLQYHYQPDYEEKKQRVLKGKLGQQLLRYFPDLKDAASKKHVLPEDSEDEAYDTDLDTDLGSELLAAERCRVDQDLGPHPEYKRHCQRYQVVPNSYFLRHITDERLQLNFRYLSFGDSYALAKEIENQPSISTLNLEDNAIGPAGMMCFADMLKKNSYIHEVNLSDNKLGVIGARLLKNVMLKNARLVSVNVSGNGFGERGARYLADVIDRNDTIKHLYIAHNAIGDTGATLIGKALGNNSTLKTLDLSWNHIRRKGALGLSKGLKNNCTLRTLLLSMNGLHVEGTRLLMNGLRGNDSLRELDLSANRVDVEGARWVARTLPHLLQLTCLKLAFNPLTSEGAEQVVKALMNCPFSPLQFVDFEGVTLEDYFQLLAEELMRQRQDTGLRLLYHIPPSTRERSIDLPVDTLTKVTDLLEEHHVEVRDLFQDVPEDDQLILSTQDLFSRVQKSGKVSDPHRVSRLKQSVHRDLHRRFLLKDLLMLSANRRQSHLEALRGAQALDTPELREVQNSWRYPRPRSSNHPSPLDDCSNPLSPSAAVTDQLETSQTSLQDARES
ncbi:uncharacterized protein LOC143296661 [Babylonia areolata]|uniref:uncharacterized protein LOC143296661 n=1 Tax=Babylonia areolata TaxID=304850 RepID=UPI003FCF943D